MEQLGIYVLHAELSPSYVISHMNLDSVCMKCMKVKTSNYSRDLSAPIQICWLSLTFNEQKLYSLINTFGVISCDLFAYNIWVRSYTHPNSDTHTKKKRIFDVVKNAFRHLLLLLMLTMLLLSRVCLQYCLMIRDNNETDNSTHIRCS